MSTNTFESFLKKLMYTVLLRIPKGFYVHMFINFMIRSFFIMAIDQISLGYLVGEDYAMGIKCFMLYCVIECIHGLHSAYFLGYYKPLISKYIGEICEKEILNQLSTISVSCQKDLIDGDYQSKSNAVKWNIIGFIDQIIENIAVYMGLICNVCWILYFNPFMIITYIVSIFFYLKYVSIKTSNWDEYTKIWDKYNSFRYNQLSDIIHNKQEICHSEMAKYIGNHSEKTQIDKSDETIYSEYLNWVIGIVTILNCYLIMDYIHNTQFIMLYIQYLKELKGSTRLFIGILKQWKHSNNEYIKWTILFEGKIPMGDEVKQHTLSNSLCVMSGSFFYRPSGKFTLSVPSDLIFYRGRLLVH